MSSYDLFRTNPSLEQEGIYLDYGKFRVRIARAGGANRQFQKVIERKTKPHRKAIQLGLMDEKVMRRLLLESYAEGVIVGWEIPDGDGWKSGIEDPADATKTLSYSRDNVVAVLEALPELFLDIKDRSEEVALFRDEQRDTDGKNS